LNTYGTGFHFNWALLKLTNEVRVGLAYRSSTWYTLTDELSQRLVAVSANTSEELEPDVVDPQFINVMNHTNCKHQADWKFAYVLENQDS
jgi:hypothetical protein